MTPAPQPTAADAPPQQQQQQREEAEQARPAPAPQPPPQRSTLPTLGFKLEPTPFEQLQAAQDTALADDLSSWLTSQLVGGDDAGVSSAAASHRAQQQPALGFASAGVPPLLAVQQPPQPGSYTLASNIMAQLDEGAQLPMAGHGVLGTFAGATPFLPPFQQQAAAGPQSTSELQLSTISVKLFGATPAELPDNLRAQLGCVRVIGM